MVTPINYKFSSSLLCKKKKNARTLLFICFYSLFIFFSVFFLFISPFTFKMSRNNSPLGRMLTVIDCPNSSLRFLILDCPTESTLDFYMEEFMRLHVVAVARCCQPTYSANRLNERNIQVMDLPFKDGGVVS